VELTSMNRKALTGSLWLAMGNGLQLTVALGTFLYLARVLTPHDFGTMALSAVIVDVLTVLGRFGQVEALLQDGVEDQEIRSTSFFLLLGIGLAMLAGLIATAQPLSTAFQSEQLFLMLIVLSPVPLLQNLCQVNEAIARHAFRFRSISIRNIVATVFGGLCAIVLAHFGFGALALAGQKCGFTAMYALMMCLSQRWLPSLMWSRIALVRLVRTGWDFSVNATLFFANSRIVDAVVGTFLGLAVLGALRVTWRLYEFAVQIVVAPVASVAFSSLAALSKDKTALRNAYLGYFEVLMMTTVPLFVGMALLARELVVVAAGPKWEFSSNLLSILAFSAIPTCASLLFGGVMLALHRSGDARRTATQQALATAGFSFAAVPFGIRWVVAAYALRMLIFAIDNVHRMNQALDVPAREFARRIGPAFVATAAMALGCEAAKLAMAGSGMLTRLLVVIPVSGAIYIAVLLAGERIGLWPGFTGRLIQQGRQMLRRRSKSQPAPDEPALSMDGAERGAGEIVVPPRDGSSIAG